MLAAAAAADAVVMAAAPADFRPVSVSDAKIKKADDGSAPEHRAGAEPRHPRRASRTTDPRRASVLVGFAAETGDAERHRARARAAPSWPGRAATCSSSTTSAVARCSASDENEAVVLDADGRGHRRSRAGPKSALAQVIWDRVVARLETSVKSRPRDQTVAFH